MTVTARAAEAADAAPIGTLLRRVDAAWWGEPPGPEDGRLATAVGEDLARVGASAGGWATAGRVAFRDDRRVGCALLLSAFECRLAVDPALPAAERAAVHDPLTAWLAERVDTVDAPRDDGVRLAALARHGYHPVRSWFHLERPRDGPLAPPRWPPGVTLREFDADRDLDPMHRLIYTVWTDVPSHHHRPLAEWRARFQPIFAAAPDLHVLAERDGRLVGVSTGRVLGGSHGWVAQIAVAREEGGRGLGRAVLLEQLRRLGDAGTRVQGLTVNGDNPRALRLYRSAGLRVTREFLTCARGPTPAAQPKNTSASA